MPHFIIITVKDHKAKVNLLKNQFFKNRPGVLDVPDLKKHVEETYGVTCIEVEEEEEVAIKQEVEDEYDNNGSGTPQIQETRRTLRSSANGNSSTNGNQAVIIEDDEPGTYVPYIDRIPPPKIETIEDDDEEAPAVPTKKRRVRNFTENEIQCQVCKKNLNSSYLNLPKATDHVGSHLELRRFGCQVAGCELTFKDMTSARKHLKSIHKIQKQAGRRIELSAEENKKLNDKINECFPGLMMRYVTERKNKKDVPTSVVEVPVVRNKTRKRRIGATEQNGVKCHSCLKMLNPSYRNFAKATDHVVSHLELKRSMEQDELLNDKIIECFPGLVKDVTERRNKKGVPTFSINGDQVPKSGENNGITCMLCLKPLGKLHRQFSKAKTHAIFHTALNKLACSVDKCNYQCGSHIRMTHHMEDEHPGVVSPPNKLDLTEEEEKKLDQKTRECFPHFKDENKVCNLCEVPIANTNVDQYHQKSHSNTHLDFPLFKCTHSKCKHKTKIYNDIALHMWGVHRVKPVKKENHVIKLTDAKKREVEAIYKKCFPNNAD